MTMAICSKPARSGGRGRWHLCFAVVVALATAQAAQARSFVYVTDVTAPGISQFARVFGGLAPLAPPAVPTANQPVGIAAGPAGHDVYVTSDFPQSALLHYAVGPHGGLILRDTAPVPNPAVLDEPLAVSPDGRSVYALNTAGNGSVLQYTVGSNGSLIPKSPATVPDTGVLPTALTISADSRSVYVVDSTTGSNTVAQYTAARDGTLTPKTRALVPAGQDAFAGASSIVLSRDGRSAYVADFEGLVPHLGYISQFSVARDGTLTPMTPATVAADGHPTGLATTLDGRYLYATSQAFAGTVLTFRVGPGGRLTATGRPTPAGEYPIGIALTGRCRFTWFGPRCRQSVYAANAGSNDLSVYSVGANGALRPGCRRRFRPAPTR